MFEKHLITPSHLETFPLVGVLVLGGTFKGGAVPLAHHPRLHHFSLKIGTMRSRQPSNLRNGPSVMKFQVYPMNIHSKSSKTMKEATELTFQIRNSSITCTKTPLFMLSLPRQKLHASDMGYVSLPLGSCCVCFFYDPPVECSLSWGGS